MVFRKDSLLGVRWWVGGNPLVSGRVDCQCGRIRWKSLGFHCCVDFSSGGFCRHL